MGLRTPTKSNLNLIFNDGIGRALCTEYLLPLSRREEEQSAPHISPLTQEEKSSLRRGPLSFRLTMEEQSVQRSSPRVNVEGRGFCAEVLSG